MPSGPFWPLKHIVVIISHFNNLLLCCLCFSINWLIDWLIDWCWKSSQVKQKTTMQHCYTISLQLWNKTDMASRPNLSLSVSFFTFFSRSAISWPRRVSLSLASCSCFVTRASSSAFASPSSTSGCEKYSFLMTSVRWSTCWRHCGHWQLMLCVTVNHCVRQSAWKTCPHLRADTSPELLANCSLHTLQIDPSIVLSVSNIKNIINVNIKLTRPTQ